MGDIELGQGLKVRYMHQEVANLKLHKLLDSTVFEWQGENRIELHAWDWVFHEPKVKDGYFARTAEKMQNIDYKQPGPSDHKSANEQHKDIAFNCQWA